MEHFNKCYPNAIVDISTIKFRTKKNAPTQKAVFAAITEPAETTSKPEKTIDALIEAGKAVDDTSDASDTSFIDEIVKPKTIAAGINSLVEAGKTIENPEEETVDAETINALTSTDEEVMVTITKLQKNKKTKNKKQKTKKQKKKKQKHYIVRWHDVKLHLLYRLVRC